MRGYDQVPGWKVWTSGGTREAMQRANRDAGLPCYCASLWSGPCDFCSGIEREGSERWALMLIAQREEGAR